MVSGVFFLFYAQLVPVGFDPAHGSIEFYDCMIDVSHHQYQYAFLMPGNVSKLDG